MALMYVDGRPKFYDPDIDWHAINQGEYVSRLAAVPFYEEAGSLLQSAAHLWPGRVRGQALTELGHELLDRGRSWRRSALGWSDPGLKVHHRNLPREQVPEACGPILTKFWDARRHMLPYGAPKPLPHDAAARRLVGAAVELMEASVMIVGKTGQRLYRTEEAEKLQDQIEVLRDSIRGPELPKPSEAGLRAIKLRAVTRVCDGLCYTAAHVFGNSYDRNVEIEKDMQLWYDRSAAFSKRWQAEYERFISLETEDPAERAALLSARDEASPYTPTMTDRHYESAATRGRAAAVIDGLIRLLCLAATRGFDAQMPELPEGAPVLDCMPELLLP